MRQFLVVLLLLSACSSTETGSSAPSERAVAVVAVGCRPAPATGSGTWVTADRVLTVAHTVAGADQVSVDGTPARIVAIDTGDDLALLAAEGGPAEPAEFGAASTGDTGTFVGFGADHPGPTGYLVTSTPQVTMTDIYDEGPVRRRPGMSVEAPVEEGDSGAALLADDGRIVGMLFATSRPTPDRGWATRAERLAEFVDTHGDDATTAAAVPCR